MPNWLRTSPLPKRETSLVGPRYVNLTVTSCGVANLRVARISLEDTIKQSPAALSIFPSGTSKSAGSICPWADGATSISKHNIRVSRIGLIIPCKYLAERSRGRDQTHLTTAGLVQCP